MWPIVTNVPWFVCLLDITLSHPKRLNKSKSCLGCGLGWVCGTMSYGAQTTQGKGQFGGSMSRPFEKYRNIWHKPKLFTRWQQWWGPVLWVVQHLVVCYAVPWCCSVESCGLLYRRCQCLFYSPWLWGWNSLPLLFCPLSPPFAPSPPFRPPYK